MSESRGTSLETREVSFTYRGGEQPALEGVSVTLQPGQFGYLMGRTGAGKTSLCLCLNGIIPAMQTGEFGGTVLVGGEDIHGRGVYEVAGQVGELFQAFETQLLSSDVEAEIAFGLENAQMPRDEMRQRVDEMLALVGLGDMREREPSTLSGGQKQRLALAAILAPSPAALILDEPTTDIDPRGKQELMEIVDQLTEQGFTLLVADHETEDALQADVLMVLAEGRVAYSGPPAELLADPQRCLELGVRPLDMPALFAALGRPERPLTPEEAAEVLGAESLPTPADAPAVDEAETTVIVEVEDVHFAYPEAEREALAGVSVSIREGEFVVILGENGSGKTTLAKHLNGLAHPMSGHVTVAGLDTRTASPQDMARQVGYLFQNPDHQIFAETVEAEIAFGPRNLGIAADEISKRVRDSLDMVGLAGYEDRDPFVLTKGERQRVALASILAQKPNVIVFDEPTTGLDGPQQEEMMQLLARLNRDGQTVIIITHCTWAAAGYARRALVMDEGLLVGDLPVRELFEDDELLARADQVRPQVAELSAALGCGTFLSVAEAVERLRPSTGGDA